MASNVAMGSRANQELRENFKAYNPPQSAVYVPQTISIRLFGRLGHGKSTFINNCLSVVHNTEYRNEAVECEVPEGSTVKLTPHRLSDWVNIVDNRGIKCFDFNELYEFSAQLDGIRKERQRITFGGPRVEEWKSTLIVPVLICRADFASFDLDKPRIQSFIDTARKQTGMWPIIVVTRAKEDMYSKLKSFFQSLHCSDIFLLSNYHHKESKDGREIPVERNEETDKLILEILLKCLKRADDVLKSISTSQKPTTLN